MRLKKILAALAIAALPSVALAQSNPGLTYKQVPTAGQWNSYFSAKQDNLGFTPLNSAGGTMNGRLVTAAPGATVAGFNLFPGTAPGSPVNGDLWVTSAGFYARVNGSTVGPMGAGLTSVGANTVLGSIAGGLPTAITQTQLTALINPFTTSLSGAVPSPGSATNKFLRDDGTWQTVGGTATITLGSSVMSGFTTGRVVYNNAGVAGEYSISGSGSVAMTTSPTFTTPTLGAAIGTSVALGGATLGASVFAVTGTTSLGGILTVTSTSANALMVGANGVTNPGLQVDNSNASVTTGIKITPQAVGGSVSIRAISSGTNESLTLDAKGSGVVSLGSISTGGVSINGALVGSAFGTNVATALGTAAGAVNGFPLVIATGTIALGTSAIGSGSCSAAATSSATGTATTDVIDVSFNGDPTATTGYSASGMLSVVVYPTANTVNVKQCNLTGSSITPAALTLNWRVRR